MRKNLVWVYGMSCVFLFSSLVSTAAMAQPARELTISIASSQPGGAYYLQAAALAEVLLRKGKVAGATAEATAGGIENVRLVDKNAVTLGIVSADYLDKAVRGEKPFEKPMDITIVSPIQQAPLFFVTLAKNPVKSISDFRGKKIAVGHRGGGLEQQARTILPMLGLSFNDFEPRFLSFNQAGEALREGMISAAYMCCPPNNALTELSQLADIRVVPFSPEQLDKLVKHPWFSRSKVWAGAFRGVDKDVPTLGIATGLITSSKTKDEIAYTVAKTLIDNLKELTAKAPQYGRLRDFFKEARTDPKVLEVAGVPLHPGARKAFVEAGILH